MGSIDIIKLMNIKKLLLILLIFVSIVFLLLNKNKLNEKARDFVGSDVTQENALNKDTQTTETEDSEVKIVAQNLQIPWEIAFVKNDTILVTERVGKLIQINIETGETKLIQEFEEVREAGEGGLLGLALHPDFINNQKIYVYYTYQIKEGLRNRVESFKFINDSLSDRQVIIEGIRGANNHDGGRIAFGPDGYLYITVGDAQETNLAQDTNSLNGKILRIGDDGTIPSDNPFNSAVYSYGHRNPQGLAWDDKGQLWSTEHGPSGLQSGNDELNLITKGANYGWPTIKGTQTSDGMLTPKLESGSNDTWAPGQLIYINDTLVFTGPRGAAIYTAKISYNEVSSLKEYFKDEFGRIRTIVLGPDGNFYIATSNTDGRGKVLKGDDKIIRISPKLLDIK